MSIRGPSALTRRSSDGLGRLYGRKSMDGRLLSQSAVPWRAHLDVAAGHRVSMHPFRVGVDETSKHSPTRAEPESGHPLARSMRSNSVGMINN
jgi:hypothetical protein